MDIKRKTLIICLVCLFVPCSVFADVTNGTVPLPSSQNITSTANVTTNSTNTTVLNEKPLPANSVNVNNNQSSTSEPAAGQVETSTVGNNDNIVINGSNSTTTSSIENWDPSLNIDSSEPLEYLIIEILLLLFITGFILFGILKTWSIYYGRTVFKCFIFDGILIGIKTVCIFFWNLIKACCDKLCVRRTTVSTGYTRTGFTESKVNLSEHMTEYPLELFRP